MKTYILHTNDYGEITTEADNANEAFDNYAREVGYCGYNDLKINGNTEIDVIAIL